MFTGEHPKVEAKPTSRDNDLNPEQLPEIKCNEN
jgi:hypothetical protein